MHPQELIDQALKEGAQAAEVYQASSESRSAIFEANRLKQIESSEEEGTALRVWKEDKVGLAVAYGPIDGKALVAKALALAEFGEITPIDLAHESIRTPEKNYEPIPSQTLIAWGETVIQGVRERFNETICSASFGFELEAASLTNSEGLDSYHQTLSLGGYIGVEWVRGDDFLAVYEGDSDAVIPEPQKIIQRVLDRLEWAKENVPAPIGTYPVIFTANAVSTLLGTVLAAMNGRAVLEKSSPWTDKRGEQVLSPLLTIQQDPNFGPFPTPFDDEGTPTQILSFLTEGILNNFYADRQVSRTLGLALTGNGMRDGLGGFPKPGVINAILTPGTLSLEQLVAQVDRGLLVDQVLGGGAGLSGELSVNIDLGYAIEKGKILGRVKDTMIAGNAYKLLNQVVAVGQERFWEGALYTPALLVEGVSISSKEPEED
jgi:PmbA protein